MKKQEFAVVLYYILYNILYIYYIYIIVTSNQIIPCEQLVKKKLFRWSVRLSTRCTGMPGNYYTIRVCSTGLRSNTVHAAKVQSTGCSGILVWRNEYQIVPGTITLL